MLIHAYKNVDMFLSSEFIVIILHAATSYILPNIVYIILYYILTVLYWICYILCNTSDFDTKRSVPVSHNPVLRILEVMYLNIIPKPYRPLLHAKVKGINMTINMTLRVTTTIGQNILRIN